MIYSEFLRLKYSTKTKAGIFLSLCYMVILTFLLVEAIPDMVNLYKSVGIIYKIDDFFFLWFGYYRFMAISSFGVLFFATRYFPFLILPLLLSWFGADTFLTDYINHCIPLLYLRSSRKKYFLGKLIVIFIVSFSIVLLMLLFQLLLSTLGCFYLKHKGILIPDFKFTDLFMIGITCIKIPLYYSSLAAVSYAITLFVKIPAAPFMLPVMIAVGSSVLFAETTNNIPMDLAFYDSGLMTPHMEIYWISVVAFLIIAVVLTWVKVCMTREVLEDC